MSLLKLLISKKKWLWILAAALVLFAGFITYIFFSLPDVSNLKMHNPEMTALMEMRIKQAEKKSAEFAINHIWVSFEQIPQLMKDTVRIAEDTAFYWHKGIDFDELKESIKKNIRERKFSRGGSTITQQLAKNLYLSTEKSVLRKIKEYLIARRMEKILTKDRIFELYLNVIELGPGIFGVQAASLDYFGHTVNQVTLEEIVRLTAVIPRPLRSDPREKSTWMQWRCRWLLDKLRLYDYISEEIHQGTVAIFTEGSRPPPE